jgi:hypothetical protein
MIIAKLTLSELWNAKFIPLINERNEFCTPDKWAQDPYDASIKSSLMRNRAEVEEYDALFPDHPLSRARTFLNQVQQTLQVAEQVKTKPSFKYVKPSSPGKSWWKFW